MPPAMTRTAEAAKARKAPTNAPGRVRAVRSAMANMASVPQVGEVLGHVVDAGAVERPGDPAVGEEDHAIRVRRRGGVVGDHDDRPAVVVDEVAEELEDA